MKKIILVLLSFLSFNSYAQENWTFKWEYQGSACYDPYAPCCIMDSANVEHIVVEYKDTTEYRLLFNKIFFKSPRNRTAIDNAPTNIMSINQTTGQIKISKKDSLRINYSQIDNAPEIDAIPVGTVISGIWSSAPDGYLLLRGGTIGDATSGATVFANDLMEDLFMCLWQHLADSEASVSGGRGASAAADWAAHKTITLPDTRQRFVLGKATSGTGTTLGGTGGQIDMVYSIDPPATASSSDGDHNHGGATGASANINNVTLLALGSAASPSHTHTISNDGSHSHSTNISAFNTGSNNPAFISLNMAIKY